MTKLDCRYITLTGWKTSWRSKQIMNDILRQGCTTQISWRAKFNWGHNQGPKWICINKFKGCFYHRKKLNKENKGLWGQIKNFRGPHLARGPYVVHPCFRGWYTWWGFKIMSPNTSWGRHGVYQSITWKCLTIFERNLTIKNS